jgi:hypothetical protein
MARYEQLELPLFAPPAFDELLSALHANSLEVELQQRLKRSWHVMVNRLTGKRTLKVPALLEHAPREVKQALIDWALLYDRRGALRRERRTTKRALEHTVWKYLEQHHPESRRTARSLPLQEHLRTEGCRYDLREVFAKVNQESFGGRLQSLVRWGGFATLTSFHRTVAGPDGARQNLVTIAGAYDHPDVPRFAIESVMHHELLHIAVPPVVRNGRRVVHGRDFRTAERVHPHYAEWERWQRTHVAKLASALRRSRKSRRR